MYQKLNCDKHFSSLVEQNFNIR